MKEIKPRGHMVHIEQLEDEVEQKSKSGLILVGDDAKDTFLKGKVLSFGKDVKCLKKGDKILYNRVLPIGFKTDQGMLISINDVVATY